MSGNNIGEWNRINASWALFYSPALKLGFRIDIPRNVEAYHGRETNSLELNWSGIIFSAAPKTTLIEYDVNFGTLRELMEVEPAA